MPTDFSVGSWRSRWWPADGRSSGKDAAFLPDPEIHAGPGALAAHPHGEADAVAVGGAQLELVAGDVEEDGTRLGADEVACLETPREASVGVLEREASTAACVPVSGGDGGA